MKWSKRQFTIEERQAVWDVHERRCWFCRESIEFQDTAIDHVIPESLLGKPDELVDLLLELRLPSDFNVNGPENWLPIHERCNREKGDKLSKAPRIVFVLERLQRRAPEVARRTAVNSTRIQKGRAIAPLLAALKEGVVTPDDLRQHGLDVLQVPIPYSERIVMLDGGRWVYQREVAYEGLCECERTCCVGAEGKVLCLFPSSLSPWIIKKRLFWKCYDEVIVCPRCSLRHSRGHIGSCRTCAKPYRDQDAQSD